MDLMRREAQKRIGLGGMVLVGGTIVKSPLTKTQLAHASDDQMRDKFSESICRI